ESEANMNKAMEVEEDEVAELTVGPHIETKKRKRTASGFTTLGTLMENVGSWRAEDGWVGNPCHRLNWSCVWRQDNKKVCTCYFCQRGKMLCTVDPAKAEAHPSKKLRVMEKGKAKESEPET